MALKIEIETSIKPLEDEGRELTEYVYLQMIINNALSVNTMVDFKGKVFELPVLATRYFEVGFMVSHAWVCQKGSTERLLLITEKQK
jgi:hypothetical protein